MVWYKYLDRSTPYIKNYRRWNMWYDYNNAKHHEICKINLNLSKSNNTLGGSFHEKNLQT